MITLSDYLDYLNNEIIQARKLADENSVLVAQEYAKHEHLKYFKVPRYNIPVVKMDIPIKVENIDADSKYNFKYDEKLFLKDVNTRILDVNKTKGLNITPMTEVQVKNVEFTKLFKTLEVKDQKYSKDFKVDVKNTNLPLKISSLKLDEFRPQDDNDQEVAAFKEILTESLLNRYSMVGSRLNNLYIDPNTTSSEDKDKVFINLHVEMEEEGIRIIKMKNAAGQDVEEIIFE